MEFIRRFTRLGFIQSLTTRTQSLPPHTRRQFKSALLLLSSLAFAFFAHKQSRAWAETQWLEEHRPKIELFQTLLAQKGWTEISPSKLKRTGALRDDAQVYLSPQSDIVLLSPDHFFTRSSPTKPLKIDVNSAIPIPNCSYLNWLCFQELATTLNLLMAPAMPRSAPIFHDPRELIY